MKRLLLFTGKLGYQTRGFAEAARTLGAEVTLATDRCHQLEDPWADGAIPLHFENPMEAAQRVVESVRGLRVHGMLALGDRPVATAAYAARDLDIPYNSPNAVENCRSKLRQREVLHDAGVRVPQFFSFSLAERMETILTRVSFPCVVKPFRLSASQGVIRANDPIEFRAAVPRLEALMASSEVQSTREGDLNRLLVETYIPGEEVAVEALLTRGELRVLAIFDKPDRMEGPFFEESIYVTPSRLSGSVQEQIEQCTHSAVKALGLTHGPVHAEFRINETGPWVLEVAPRPIGGLCARALRFGPQKISLEELLVRHALELPGSDASREAAASGVMMVPIPKSGLLKGVKGVEQASAVEGVYDVQITARIHDFLAAWPEGSTYLGFIFARGSSSEDVEASLRQAHSKLRFEIVRRLAAEHPATKRFN